MEDSGRKTVKHPQTLRSKGITKSPTGNHWKVRGPLEDHSKTAGVLQNPIQETKLLDVETLLGRTEIIEVKERTGPDTTRSAEKRMCFSKGI